MPIGNLSEALFQMPDAGSRMDERELQPPASEAGTAGRRIYIQRAEMGNLG